jgi:hypothetical protein
VSDLTKRLLREADSALGKPLCDGGQLFREAAKRITQQELKLRRIAELQRYYIPMHIEDPNFRKNHAVPLKSKDGPWIKHSELRALLAKHKEIEDE